MLIDRTPWIYLFIFFLEVVLFNLKAGSSKENLELAQLLLQCSLSPAGQSNTEQTHTVNRTFCNLDDIILFLFIFDTEEEITVVEITAGIWYRCHYQPYSCTDHISSTATSGLM